MSDILEEEENKLNEAAGVEVEEKEPEAAPVSEEEAEADPEPEPIKTSKELGEEKLAHILEAAPLLKKFATFEVDDAGNIGITPEFELDDFDIAFEDYFYEKNHPEEEDAALIGQFFSKIYTAAAIKCNQGGGVYTIDCWKNRYTARKVEDIEAIHYAAMNDTEKAEYDLQKKKNSLNNDISSAQGYLRKTDYITAKMIEAIAAGDNDKLTELLEHYKSELAERENARVQIRNVEAELEKLK